ncbi:MAG: IclR family transcriptional regulator [Lachnospiraceae bacterium]|nr:IclR family transcriptional regulator [Lachnospiraceae bacterium]
MGTVNIQSVERAINILKCFEKHAELRGTEIGKMLSLNKSTVFGLIRTLEQNNFLEQNEETGKYHLGFAVFQLGLLVNFDLKHIASPYVDELAKYTQETVNLVIRDGNYVLYIKKQESSHSMRICTKEGQHLPIHCTAVGKSILAFLPEEEVLGILDSIKYEQFTKNTLTSKESILKELPKIKETHLSYDREEFELGLFCVASPIFDSSGKPIGGVSVSGPITRMHDEAVKSISKNLLKAAGEINAKLKEKSL